MAPHSSTLAWKSPWAEEPDGLLTILGRVTEVSTSLGTGGALTAPKTTHSGNNLVFHKPSLGIRMVLFPDFSL